MSNIVIYLPNEPLGKQGGMERATHRLAAMLAGEGHRVTLLCRNKNRLGEEYVPPTDLVFIPASLRREEEQDFLLNLIKERGIETIIDQTEGGIVGRWGIFRRRGHMNGVSVKLIAVQHSSQYTYLKHYRTVNRKPAGRGLIGKTRSFFYNTFILALKKCRAVLLQRSLFRELASDYDQIVTLSEGGIEEFKNCVPPSPGTSSPVFPISWNRPLFPGKRKKNRAACLSAGWTTPQKEWTGSCAYGKKWKKHARTGIWILWVTGRMRSCLRIPPKNWGFPELPSTAFKIRNLTIPEPPYSA